MTEWLKGKCVVCGKTYEYPDCIYVPKTCNTYHCFHQYKHNPKRYEDLNALLDGSRKRVGI